MMDEQQLPYSSSNGFLIALINRGYNISRVGCLCVVDRNPASFDIVHLRVRRNAAFATLLPQSCLLMDLVTNHTFLYQKVKYCISILEVPRRS